MPVPFRSAWAGHRPRPPTQLRPAPRGAVSVDVTFEIRLSLSELVLVGFLTSSFIVALEIYLRVRHI